MVITLNSDCRNYTPEQTSRGEQIITASRNVRPLAFGYMVAEDKDGALRVFPSDPAIKDAKKIFTDSTVSGVFENIAVPSNNNALVYYCQKKAATGITRLQIKEGEVSEWVPEFVRFPNNKRYTDVSGMQFDPTGNFLLFTCAGESTTTALRMKVQKVVILNARTLEEVQVIPDTCLLDVDTSGDIRVMQGNEGTFAIIKANFAEVAGDIQRMSVERAAAGIQVDDLFAGARAKSAESGAVSSELLPLIARYSEQFKEKLKGVTSLEEVASIRSGTLEALRNELLKRSFSVRDTNFIIDALGAGPVLARERELALERFTQDMPAIQSKLAQPLTIVTIDDIGKRIRALELVQGLLVDDAREQFLRVHQEYDTASSRYFAEHAVEVVKSVKDIVGGAQAEMSRFETKAQMDMWLDTRRPAIKGRLQNILRNLPMGASQGTNAFDAVASAIAEFDDVSEQYERKFRERYEEIRAKAAERTEALTTMVENDIRALVDRLRSERFASRAAAEQFLQHRKTAVIAAIAGIAESSVDIAEELRNLLDARCAQALGEVERRGEIAVDAQDGRQMVPVGNILFPVWEQHEMRQRNAECFLDFDVQESAFAQSGNDDAVIGELVVRIKGADGKVTKVNLFEGLEKSNFYRVRGMRKSSFLFKSRVNAITAELIDAKLRDWNSGRSKIRAEWRRLREELKVLYLKREKTRDSNGNRVETDGGAWKEAYKVKLAEYSQFLAENYVPLLQRFDTIARQNAAPSLTNGGGSLREWSPNWVVDPQTETLLTKIATEVTGQLRRKEGVLFLRGHAGTGKDVLVDMFCSLTKRPYFPVDCTKWTTEFELSQDISLDVDDGVSVTVREDSAVLKAIQTPGAVLYFNEFSALPPPAQIFLNSLFDGKRSITLKTSGGKIVKAHPTVIMMGSHNPEGYDGTFPIQTATGSRSTTIEVDYPPLLREPDQGDVGREKPYDATDALRMARAIRSLRSLTNESNLKKNPFVQLWDSYVNGIETGAPAPTREQQFDIDCVLAMVQFADKLRQNYKGHFDQTDAARKAKFTVTKPISTRELYRCADALSSMPLQEKSTADPEVVARRLLGAYFVSSIASQADRNDIRSAMETWTSKKRVK